MRIIKKSVYRKETNDSLIKTKIRRKNIAAGKGAANKLRLSCYFFTQKAQFHVIIIHAI